MRLPKIGERIEFSKPIRLTGEVLERVGSLIVLGNIQSPPTITLTTTWFLRKQIEKDRKEFRAFYDPTK